MGERCGFMEGNGVAVMINWNGKRIEFEMLHPAFKNIFGWSVCGEEACRELNVHPMFPTTEEINAVTQYIANSEPKY